MLIERDNEYPLDGIDYCFKAWREFTTLTEQEHKNYAKMMKLKEPRQLFNPIKVLCVQTGEIFYSATKVANFLGVSKEAIKLAIRKRFPILGLNFVEVEE